MPRFGCFFLGRYEMYRGYIKIWRKTFDSGIQRDPKLFLLWVYLLTEATHKEIDLLIGNQKVHLVPGQLVTGRKTLAKNLFLSQQEIRTRLLRLEKFGNLTIKSTNKFSIISIINWDTYQVKESVTNQQSNQHLTSNQPALNHKQEHKNVKNIRKKDIYTSKFLKFWESYPKKVGKDAAYKSFQKRNSDMPEVDQLLSIIRRQKTSRQWKEGYIPNPTTWLNQGRWDDELEYDGGYYKKPKVEKLDPKTEKIRQLRLEAERRALELKKAGEI